MGNNEKVSKIDSEYREKELVAQILANKEVFLKSIPYLEADYFDYKKTRRLVSTIKRMYANYKIVPTKSSIYLELDFDVPENWLDIEEPWDENYLTDQVNSFVKERVMKRAIEKSIEHIDRKDYGAIEKDIKEAVSVDLDMKLGMSFDSSKESFDELFSILTSKETTIPTGWYNVDEKLQGGVTIPSLNYLLAKSGGGKSVGLINLSWNYIQQGRDVLYVSLELKEPKILKRYYSHSAKIPSYRLEQSGEQLRKHLEKCEEKGYGKFTVQFFQPNTLNSMKLEAFVRNYIQKYNRTPIIMLDYAGLMIPNTKNWNGMFERDKFVSEELRGVAISYNTVIWTADQFNRCISFGEKVITPEGEKKIEDVKVGDKVLGRNNEYRTVTAVSEPEKQKVFLIKTKSGRTIKVSERHIFPKLVDGKLVEDSIQSGLKAGDKLIIN